MIRLARSGAKFAYIPAILAEIQRMDGSLSSNVTRHMRNRLNVRRYCLKRARDEGILSPSEFRRHGIAWPPGASPQLPLTKRGSGI
jgi:hypothetical protein